MIARVTLSAVVFPSLLTCEDVVAPLGRPSDEVARMRKRRPGSTKKDGSTDRAGEKRDDLFIL